MTPRRLPSLHLQLIGCTDRSAVKWRVWSTAHSCSALAGAYIHSSGDNALSVESMVGWPYQVAVSSPFTSVYVPLGLSLFDFCTMHKRTAEPPVLEVTDQSDMLDDDILRKSCSQVTLPLLQPGALLQYSKYTKLTLCLRPSDHFQWLDSSLLFLATTDVCTVHMRESEVLGNMLLQTLKCTVCT